MLRLHNLCNPWPHLFIASILRPQENKLKITSPKRSARIGEKRSNNNNNDNNNDIDVEEEGNAASITEDTYSMKVSCDHPINGPTP